MIPVLPRRWLIVLLAVGCSLLTMACAVPQVSAQERLFTDVSVEFLDRVTLDSQIIGGTQFGGISAIAYDPRTDRLLALSDEHDGVATPHFYTLALDLQDDPAQPGFETVEVESVTFLRDQSGDPLAPDALDPEGLALSPSNTLYLSSEGIHRKDIQPFLGEFDRESGTLLRSLPVPRSFTISFDETTRRQQQGIQSNQGLESLTLVASGAAPIAEDPLRLFTVNEAPLVQDLDPSSDEGGRTRFLHYYLGQGPPLLVAEHLYALEPVPFALVNGLSEILALDNGGHFLALERALTPLGLQVKLFEITLAGATDIAGLASLKGEINATRIQKQLIYNFNADEEPARNLEGMTLGPRLPDGSQSLLLVSDNNFSPGEDTELLLFRLNR
ncbi:MAG: esterase-like activity of phytase family protein [Prochlorothrix sp.]|nr:esterase-like activity of phytase family protein [Prochlorothrix sp.]